MCTVGSLDSALSLLEVTTKEQAGRIAAAWLLPIERERGLSTQCEPGVSLDSALDGLVEQVNYVARRQGLLDALLEGAG